MRSADEGPCRDRELAIIRGIARRQKALLARGDLAGVVALQTERQEVLERIQSLDDDGRGLDRRVVGEILETDRGIRLLLLTQLAEIQTKLQTVASLKKLIRSKRPSPTRPPNRVSERA